MHASNAVMGQLRLLKSGVQEQGREKSKTTPFSANLKGARVESGGVKPASSLEARAKGTVHNQLHLTNKKDIQPTVDKAFERRNGKDIQPRRSVSLHRQQPRGAHVTAFDKLIQSTRRLGSWNSEAGDVAINWIVSRPALTDGRRVCVLNRDGELSDRVSREEALGGEDIYLMLDRGHYSPVKLKQNGSFDLTPEGEINVVPTPDDGDCFYRAVLSALSDGRVTPQRVSRHDIQTMRNVVADMMLQDRENIEPFLNL